MRVVEFLSKEGQALETKLLDQLITDAQDKSLPAKGPQHTFIRTILESANEGSGCLFLTAT